MRGTGSLPSGKRTQTGGIDVLPAPARADLAATPLGLYLHVPFCVRRCGYCAFTTYAEGEVGDPDAHAHWAAGARREIDLADRVLGPDRPPLSTIYLGGGTPTAVAPEVLLAVIDHARDRLGARDGIEVTVEANPDGLRPGQLAALRDGGVDRVSFGMQSLSTRVLRLLDRTHDPERALTAVGEARAAGFDHVSLDLIYGTPGERPEDWSASVQAALGTDIDHLSAYALAIEPGTRLAARVRAGSLPAPSGDDAADRYEELDRRCRAAGFEWYELSNWAADPSARSRHNLLYWHNQHWWGVGPGAHSHVGGLRWWNHTGLAEWQGALAAGHSPAAGHESPDDDAHRLERIMLGIRLAEGLPTDTVADDVAVAAAQADGLVEQRGDRIVLTDRGRLLADLVVRRLAG